MVKQIKANVNLINYKISWHLSQYVANSYFKDSLCIQFTADTVNIYMLLYYRVKLLFTF